MRYDHIWVVRRQTVNNLAFWAFIFAVNFDEWASRSRLVQWFYVKVFGLIHGESHFEYRLGRP